jgi:hypothetical protein
MKASQKKKVHLVEAKFDSCAPIMKVVYRRIPLKGILVDGGARVHYDDFHNGNFGVAMRLPI